MKKASPELKYLHLILNYMSGTVNLDSCLDAIFRLEKITTLSLIWNRLSLDKIKSSLREQGGKKRWETLVLGPVDQKVNDSDILEICFYLPSLIEWTVASPRSTITVDGAREWKRICPDLEIVHFGSRGLPEEVKEVLQELGVTVK
jgi:hypothetical protein